MRAFALVLGGLGVSGCFQPGQFACLGESPPPACVEANSSSGSTGSTGSTSSTGDTTGETVDAGSESASGTSASTTSEDTTTEATTGEPAECGDGVLDPGEECDDGDLDPTNGCNQCARDRWIFVTGEPFVAGGKIGGLFGADQDCRMRAALAGHPEPLNFKAWLSDSQTDARDRLFHSKGRYVLPNGLVVVDSWDELVSGTLQNPINASELGALVEDQVWTGTRPDGTKVPGIAHCDDWDDIGGGSLGSWGLSIFSDAGWTDYAEPIVNPTECDAMQALYCLEQE